MVRLRALRWESDPCGGTQSSEVGVKALRWDSVLLGPSFVTRLQRASYHVSMSKIHKEV